MPRIRRMLLRWNVLSLLSCVAHVTLVHVSQPYNTVLVTQANTVPGVCPHSSRYTIWTELKLPSQSSCRYLCPMILESELGELADITEFLVVDGNDRRCLPSGNHITVWGVLAAEVGIAVHSSPYLLVFVCGLSSGGCEGSHFALGRTQCLLNAIVHSPRCSMLCRLSVGPISWLSCVQYSSAHRLVK